MDVIVEMLANVNLNKDLQMLSYGGRVAVSQQSSADGPEPTWVLRSPSVRTAVTAVCHQDTFNLSLATTAPYSL